MSLSLQRKLDLIVLLAVRALFRNAVPQQVGCSTDFMLRFSRVSRELSADLTCQIDTSERWLIQWHRYSDGASYIGQPVSSVQTST